MDYTFTPESGNLTVTSKTNHGLGFFENIRVGRAVCFMASSTVSLDCGLMGEFGVVNNLFDIIVASHTELPWFNLHDRGEIGSMRCMAQVTFPFGNRRMGTNSIL